ncbi:MAG: glycosyltransferase [Tepidimonas ignava]|uniref:glycosyltransferase n=1 Tax=Tepidimonas ignava TaxID=114249 RepID=UPI0039190F49
MLKILHVYRSYYPDPPGGLQEAVRQICITTAAYGVENVIFTLSPKPSPCVLRRPEGTVVRCRSWVAPASCDLGGLDVFKRFSVVAKWADAIQYHFPWPFADVLHAVVRPVTPAIMTYHSDIVRQRWLGRLYWPLMQKMLKDMRAIVATSPLYAKTSAVLSNPWHRERVRVIPLGIDENTYPQHGDDGILYRLGLVAEEPFFLFIGVLRYYKGLHTLIEAATHVNAKVVIAGTGPEGDDLKRRMLELGLRNIVFAGLVSDAEKIALLRQCRAFVLPSHLRSEAFGMVLVEASMMGKPMVSCEIGTGTSFVNVDGETGFVVPPENPVALAGAMNALLGDEALANKLGQAARRRYERMFSGPALGRAYAQLYQDVLSGA